MTSTRQVAAVDTPRARRSPAPRTVLLVAAFGAFLAFLDSTIVNIAFPDIAASFPDVGVGDLSWVLTSYNIVFAALLVVAGRFADLLGRRRIFVVGVVVFTIASALCAVAGSVPELVAYRVLQGIGAALLVPASLGLVVQGYDAARRAHGVGLWSAAAAIASGLGPPIGGALVELSSWRLAFLVNVPLGLLAIVLSRSLLVESRASGVRRLPDLRGALLLAAALGLLTFGLVQGPEWGFADLRVLGAFAGAAATTIGFVASSRNHPAPVVDRALLRIPSFTAATALTIVAGAGFYAYLLAHILFLTSVWRYSLIEAGLAVTPAALVATVVAAVLGRVADRFGHRVVAVPGALVWAAGLYWYHQQVGPTPDFLGAWLPGQILQGIGVGATLPVLGGAALAGVSGAYATASAVVSSARQLGAVLGVSGMVVLLDLPNNPDALRDGWLLAAVCFAAVAVGAFLVERDRPAPEPGAVPPKVQPVPPRTEPDAFGDLSLFGGMNNAVVARLREHAHPVPVRAGEHLFRAGDPADALYVIDSGRLQVRRGEQVLADLGRGSVLGELGLLSGAPRSASVLAVRDSVVTRLSRSDFDSVADPTTLRALAAALAARVAKTAPVAPPRRADSVVSVVALGAGPRDGADVPAIVAALWATTERWRRTVAPGQVDRERLEQAERDADLVLLGASSTDEEWREFCLRVADRVVLVVADPTLPATLPERLSGADLVFTGRAPSRDEHRGWADRLDPRSVHVLGGRDRQIALRPLGARLAGRSLGLVLGGGGARGLAHLGVLDELERAGIPVDRVAGTSMGAVLAGAVACGYDATTVDALAYEYFVRRNPVGDWTLARGGLLRGRRTEAGLAAVYGERTIEELPLQFRCVSTDLLRRLPVVHERGPLTDAVGASLRLPGLYRPLVLGDTLHIDGGFLDNLPVGTLAGPEGPVVAVPIAMGGPSSRRSGPPRIPGAAETLLRTMVLADQPAYERAVAQADVLVEPATPGVGLLEFHQIDAMREAGRAAARARLPHITALLDRTV